MTKRESDITVEPSSESPASVPVAKEASSGAYGNLKRQLDDKELTNPAVGKMLIAQIDSLSSEKTSLEAFREAFYTADKKAAIFEEKAKGEDKFKAIHSLFLTIGGIIIGLIPSAGSWPFQLSLFLCGAVAIGVSLYFVFFKK